MNARLIELLKKGRLNKGLKQSDVAKKIGVKGNTLSNYENGISEPDIDTFCALCDIYGLDPSEMLGEAYGLNVTGIDFNVKPSEITHIKKYRALDGHGKKIVDVVLDEETERMQTLAQQAEGEDDEDDVIDVDFASLKASAGNGFQLFDDCPSDKLKVLYNEKTRQADICIQVSGHSMEPVFNDGDILLVRKQPSVNVGEYGIWIINGDTGYVKKNGPDRLISVNDEYDDIYPGEFDEIRCYGKVIGVLDKNWIVE